MENTQMQIQVSEYVAPIPGFGATLDGKIYRTMHIFALIPPDENEETNYFTAMFEFDEEKDEFVEANVFEVIKVDFTSDKFGFHTHYSFAETLLDEETLNAIMEIIKNYYEDYAVKAEFENLK